MIEWLLHNWEGYVRLRLHGYSPERFLNLCNARGLEVWGLICNRDGDYEFFMTVEGYRRVKPLVRKAQVRLHITGRFGLPFFIYRHRKRWYYGAGIMAFFLVLYVMSLFIWDIQFEGNYRYTYDTLVRFLDTQDIDYGMLKARINCEDLEASMRTSFPEITWVSARVSGTRLLIHIKENEVLSTIPEKDETPCDIVASQPGIITSMVVRQGVAQVCVGDQVEEGQVLVLSLIHILDKPYRMGLESGLSAVDVVRMATLNPATHYKKDSQLGSLTPGRFADIVLLRELDRFPPEIVIANGKVAARQGRMIGEIPAPVIAPDYLNSVHLPAGFSADYFTVPAEPDKPAAAVRVIRVQDGEAFNQCFEAELEVVQGDVQPDLERDILKIAIIERYGQRGSMTTAFVNGFHLQHGAIATSYSCLLYTSSYRRPA